MIQIFFIFYTLTDHSLSSLYSLKDKRKKKRKEWKIYNSLYFLSLQSNIPLLTLDQGLIQTHNLHVDHNNDVTHRCVCVVSVCNIVIRCMVKVVRDEEGVWWRQSSRFLPYVYMGTLLQVKCYYVYIYSMMMESFKQERGK